MTEETVQGGPQGAGCAPDRLFLGLRLTPSGAQWLDGEVVRQGILLNRKVTRTEVVKAALRMYAAVPVGSRKL